MKYLHITILLMLFGTSVSAQSSFGVLGDFSQYRKESRRVVTLDERTYNPFKIQSQQSVSPSKSLNSLSNEEVAKLIGDRGIQGVVYDKAGVTGHRAIIGDTVFNLGDDIAFLSDERLTRLSTAGNVKLVKITREMLQFEISITGMASRTMEFSLASFHNR